MSAPPIIPQSQIDDQTLAQMADTSIADALVVGAVGGLIVGVAGVVLMLCVELYKRGLQGLKDAVMDIKAVFQTFALYAIAGTLGYAVNHYFSITYRIGLDDLVVKQLSAPPAK